MKGETFPSTNRKSFEIRLRDILTVNFPCSKSGRPLIKKISERKGNARPRHTISNLQLDSPGTCPPPSVQLLFVILVFFHSADVVLFTCQCNQKMIMRNCLLQQILL